MMLAKRVLVTVALLGSIGLAALLLLALATRNSLVYVSIAALVAVPLSYWFQYRFRRVCALFAVVSVTFAVIPADVFVLPDGNELRVRVLPAHYGFSCDAGEFACYGCVLPLHPVKYAVVLSY
jgi:hypothetical protein